MEPREGLAVCLVCLCCALLVSSSSATAAAAAAAAAEIGLQPRPGGPLRMTWDHKSPSGSVRVLSVMLDHRVPPAELPPSLAPYLQTNLSSHPNARVFQFHLGIVRQMVLDELEAAFEGVTLSYNAAEDGGVRVKVEADKCIGILPTGYLHRAKSKPRYLDYVARCAFAMSPSLIRDLIYRSITAKPTFDVRAGNDVAPFPLDEVLHFPHPDAFLVQLPRPQGGYPSAPWRRASPPSREPDVIRAEGVDAEPRVGVVCTKKFSWNMDDELWLLWMLDVVGVDHVIINVATRDFSMSVVRQSIKQHKVLSKRVTLVDMEVPCEKNTQTYNYLVQCQAHDLFLRWQNDFDYVFVLDTDEFVQLFDHKTSRRIDVKTLIAQNPGVLRVQGQILFKRPFIKRSAPNNQSEPMLPAFLAGLAAIDGHATAAIWAHRAKVDDKNGKTLFAVEAAIRPYLHYNEHWPRTWFSSHSGHILHIRQQFAGGIAVKDRKMGFGWFLDQFAALRTNQAAGE